MYFTANYGKRPSNLLEPATACNSAFMVQSAVRAYVPLHVPPPPPPTNNASYQCQSTIWAQKTTVGALKTGAELNGAKKISCAKTGGAAKSRKKHPRNYPPWCVLIKLKSTYCVAIMIPNKRSVSLASQQLFFKSCPRYHFRQNALSCVLKHCSRFRLPPSFYGNGERSLGKLWFTFQILAALHSTLRR